MAVRISTAARLEIAGALLSALIERLPHTSSESTLCTPSTRRLSIYACRSFRRRNVAATERGEISHARHPRRSIRTNVYLTGSQVHDVIVLDELLLARSRLCGFSSLRCLHPVVQAAGNPPSSYDFVNLNLCLRVSVVR